MTACKGCGRENPPDTEHCERCGRALHVATAPTGELLAGTLLRGGAYQVVGPLGEGGMGTVYLAKQIRLERQVAIKVLHPELLNQPNVRQRMEREAKALARIDHPNVVRIYDDFDHDGTLALVIQYIEGGTLTGMISKGPLPWTEAVLLIQGVLKGLQALHDGGLIHRDLKPDNILIDTREDTPRPKITDLGIAHDTAGRAMTRHGARLGTPEYMSPEQVRGKAVTVQTDIYACGIVLFELLTGAVPFSGDSEYDITHAQVQSAPDMSRLPADLPQHIRAVLTRTLQKEPEARFASASEMSAAFDALSAQPQEAGARKTVLVPSGHPPTASPPTHATDDTIPPPPTPPTNQDFTSAPVEIYIPEARTGNTRLVMMVTITALLIGAGAVVLESVLDKKSSSGDTTCPGGKKCPPPPPKEDAVSADEPEVVVTPSATEYSPWWCVCYQERVRGTAMRSTACRRSKDLCVALENKITLTGSQALVKGSVSASCQFIEGTHPSQHTASLLSDWKASKSNVGWWSPKGCFVP
jgi:serine/threonine protein kinase